jgi:hypothetical protein
MPCILLIFREKLAMILLCKTISFFMQNVSKSAVILSTKAAVGMVFGE